MNSVVPLPGKLPVIAESGLPVSYEAAKQAIVECQNPIECRTMADKAAAMAVYARMRDDTDLLNRAVRLQAWATRRWGELDKELYPDRSRANLKQNRADSPDCGQPQSGKRPAAPDGTTEYQRVVSRRLAAIPEAEFTRQVESATPPTVTQLASQGKSTREWVRQTSPWAAIESAEAREGCTTLEAFAAFCADHEPDLISRVVSAAEVEALRPLMAIAGEWIARLAEGFTDEQ